MNKTKTLHLGVVMLDDAENAVGGEPLGLRLVVTEDYIAKLRRLQRAVTDHALAYGEIHDDTPQWLADSPEGHPHPERIGASGCCVDGVRIVADSRQFWYEAYVDRSDIRVGTPRIAFKDLFAPDGPGETEEAAGERIRARAGFLDQYDAIEVQPVREDKTGICETCPIEGASFFSVYAHLRAGGVECLGDCDDRVSAVRLGTLIAAGMGVPFNDFSEHAPGFIQNEEAGRPSP